MLQCIAKSSGSAMPTYLSPITSTGNALITAGPTCERSLAHRTIRTSGISQAVQVIGTSIGTPTPAFGTFNWYAIVEQSQAGTSLRSPMRSKQRLGYVENISRLLLRWLREDGHSHSERRRVSR